MRSENPLITNLIKHIPDWMGQWEIPGLALAIVKDDSILFEGGFGLCSLGKPEKVDPNTLFGIGSCTKAFTATALGLLVSEGRLSWEEPVGRFLPGWALYDPWVTANINLSDLLSHRSGLPTWGGDIISYDSTYSQADVMQHMRFIPQAYPFRAGYGYTNMAFLAAGQLIPAITGLGWDEFLQQRLFAPLGMDEVVTSLASLAEKSNKAVPHEVIDAKVQPIAFGDLDATAPAGAINASIHHMAQWLRLQLGDGMLDGVQIIEPAVIQRTRTPHNLIPILPAQRQLFPSTHFSAYGLGWFLRDYHGRLLVSHGGGLPGMLSYVGFLPEENLGVAVLTNKLPNGLHQGLALQVLDDFLGLAGADWSDRMAEFAQQTIASQSEAQRTLEQNRAPGTQPSLPLSAFAGEYTNALYGTITLESLSDGLVARLSAHPHLRGELEHWHYDTFLCHWNDTTLRTSLMPFQTDGQGRVQNFRVKVSRRLDRYRRIRIQTFIQYSSSLNIAITPSIPFLNKRLISL